MGIMTIPVLHWGRWSWRGEVMSGKEFIEYVILFYLGVSMALVLY